MDFLGFNIKVRKTVYRPDKPGREMAMCYPNPQRLQKAINKLCDGVREVRRCTGDTFRAVQIEKVNAQITGLAEHYKHFVCSEAYHKIDYAVNRCAFKTFKRMYGQGVMRHLVPLEGLSNRPQQHAAHKDTALAVNVDGQWIGFTKAYLTHSNCINRPFVQAITPYTQEGRERYYRKAKKQAPLVRPPLYDGTNQLSFAPFNKFYNFEYYMNREYAFNRDKGACRCCRTTLNIGHRHCHHIKPSLPTTQVNKVPNLAWVCEICHGAIHGKGMPLYATGKIKCQIERFQSQL